MRNEDDNKSVDLSKNYLLDCKTIKFSIRTCNKNNDDNNNIDDDDDYVKYSLFAVKHKKQLIRIENQSIPIKYIDNNRLQLRQPFKILTDIWGVLVSYEFRKVLYQYIDDNLENYLRKNLHMDSIRIYIELLLKRTDDDSSEYPQMPMIKMNDSNGNNISDDELIKSIVDNLNYRRNNRKLIRNLDTIFNQIWNEGYKNKTLRPLAFDDIMGNFKKWTTDPYYIKIYTFASGPIETQKLFLNASTVGNIGDYITSGFDAYHRFKYDTNKYCGVISSLSEREAKNLYYFTDSPNKGRAARNSGMTVFIIQRPNNRNYSPDELKTFPAVKSFDQFDFIEFADAMDCC